MDLREGPDKREGQGQMIKGPRIPNEGLGRRNHDIILSKGDLESNLNLRRINKLKQKGT